MTRFRTGPCSSHPAAPASVDDANATARKPLATRSRLGKVAAGAAVLAVLSVAACTSSGDGSDASGSMPQSRYDGPDQFSYSTAVPSGGSAGAGKAPVSRVPNGLDVDAASLDRAQIKKAQVGLRADDVAAIVTSVETIAAAQGGFVDSENTSTDVHGIAQTSSLTLRVPVDVFDATVDQVSQLGSLELKKTTTVDVTGQVADVASRVTSAKESIAQLRVLFDRATKLGDVITLESELSQREADLEALEAQQRVLAAQTSLSTIAVSVGRTQSATVKVSSDDHAGFLGGLRQGWDALGTAFQGTAHALGAVLPIGLTLIVIGLLAWAAVRRLPRRQASTTGSPRPAE